MNATANNYIPADGASFFGFMGVTSALVFANMGAAYGTYKSGVGICALGVLKPDQIIKSVIPVIMAGILGIYGLIVSIILLQKVSRKPEYDYKTGYKQLSSGLCCGLSSLAAGLAIGLGGDAGVRALAQQDRIFVGMMLILSLLKHLDFMDLLLL